MILDSRQALVVSEIAKFCLVLKDKQDLDELFTLLKRNIGITGLAIIWQDSFSYTGEFKQYTYNVPKIWVDYYQTNQLLAIDPIFSYSAQLQNPIHWQTAYRLASRYKNLDLNFVGASRDFGLYDGVAYTSISPELGSMVCASAYFDTDNPSPQQLAMLNDILPYLVDSFNPLRISHNEEYTTMERDILKYASAGKSNWEISRILSAKSEQVVKRALSSIYEKLGVVNRTQACVLAEKLRII